MSETDLSKLHLESFNTVEAIDKRLAEIDRDRAFLVNRKQFLLNQTPDLNSSNPDRPFMLSVSQKVELFKGLFLGRSDVYAYRWESPNGRSGYSFSCENEWKKGLCNKPKIKCNQCPNRKYKSLDDQVIYNHLKGEQIVGLYPLLIDNTCRLLAADFDKDDWGEAAKAMSLVCKQFEIPHAIEISRSGNGAHLWVFFSEPVMAKEARQLGFALLDKAMEIHPNLSFESYDRLFPSQDLMPEGGFGNLIALPLQFQARQQGGSIFVDNSLSPYEDQWLFLSQVKSLSCLELNNLLVQLTPQSQRLIDDRLPWLQGTKVRDDKIEGCPEQVTLTLANHIYIKFEGLPSPLVARLKRLASFSNPVFFKTQALRFSTHGIPRYITCARIEQGYLSLPRGCFDEVVELLKEQNVTPDIDDRRQSGQKLNALKFLGKLKSEQLKAVKVIAQHDTGVLHAPTAFGKTVAAIGVISRRKVNTLILTHSRQLLEQWQERLKTFVAGVEVGVIGGGKKRPSGQIDIATYQSLINKKDNSVDCLIQEYGQVIIDECHHISAPRFEMALNEVRAKYVLGLTATPDRQDGHQKIIFMLAGPVRCKVKQNHAEKFTQKVMITHLTQHPTRPLAREGERPRISDVYQWLTEDISRTQKIVEDVAARVAEGKTPLILTERREHADLINQLLVDKQIMTVVLRGAMRAKDRKDANERLAETQVVVATGKYVGEGFDMPRLDTLFLALPIAWKGSLAQYAGRIHREFDGKNQVTIYDYVDSSLPMLERMFLKREKGYKAMGYQISIVNQLIPMGI